MIEGIVSVAPSATSQLVPIDGAAPNTFGGDGFFRSRSDTVGHEQVLKPRVKPAPKTDAQSPESLPSPLPLWQRIVTRLSEISHPPRQALRELATFVGLPSAIGKQGLFVARNFSGPHSAAPQPYTNSGQVVRSRPRDEAIDRDQLTARIGQVLRTIPEKGETIVPDDLSAVALLLDTPEDLMDLEALDALQSAFPRNTKMSRNRVLLAVARSLTRSFGTETRLPLAAAKAWAMLDPQFFTDAFAEQFDQIARFILNWQTEKKDFLLLDPSEMDLIEFMFEHLHPRRQGILVAKAMDFKALSMRRLGLLRRMPMRVDYAIRAAEAGGDMNGAIANAKDCLALLDHIARPGSFEPIVEEAKASAAKIVKSIQRVMAAAAPPALPDQSAPPSEQRQIAAPANAVAVNTAPNTPMNAAAAPSSPPATATPAPAPPAPPAASASPVAPPLPQTPPARLSKRHRTDAVIRVLRGEDMQDIAQALGVKSSAIESWTEAFISGGASALATRAAGPEHHGPGLHSPGLHSPTPGSPVEQPSSPSSDQETVADLQKQVAQLTLMMEQLAKADKKG